MALSAVNEHLPVAHLPADEAPRPHSHEVAAGSWIRWLLLCLFPLGLLVTPEAYQQCDGTLGFTTLTLISAAACALLLSRLGRPLHLTLPVWVIFVVFLVGYYLKFYWMTWAVEYASAWPFSSIFLEAVGSPELMFRTYELTTLGFVGFCISGALLLRHRCAGPPVGQGQVGGEDDARGRLRRYGVVLLLVLVPCMLLTGAVQHLARIGVAGMEPVPLPFGLATIVFNSRIITIPALLLLLIWLAEEWRLPKLLAAALGMLVLHGLTQMLLSSSRGILLMMILPVVFLWLRTGRFTQQRRNAALAIFVGVALLHPVITQYRMLRVTGDAAGVSGALWEAARTPAGLWVAVSTGFTSIVTRVTGAESLAYAATVPDPGLTFENVWYYLDPERGLARVFTQDVVGYGAGVIFHLTAPSLLGALYLLGGCLGVAAGAMLWPAAWMGAWAGLQRLRLVSYPVAQSVLLLLVFNLTSEGVLDGLPMWALLYGASLLLCEMVARAVVAPRGSRVPQEHP